MTKISKCLCGGEPRIGSEYVCESTDEIPDYTVFVYCTKCYIRTAGRYLINETAEEDEQHEIEAWNNFMGGHHA